MTIEYEQHAQPLRDRYAQAMAETPKARIRNVAQAMGVSELELVVANCGTIKSTLLREPAQDIFRELGTLGTVMALTRNDNCVHERHGRYEEIRAGKTMGIVLGPDIDLRLFFGEWKTAVAVNDGGRLSLQFFDKAGGAIHKVYCTNATDLDAYQTLVEKFKEPAPSWPAVVPFVAPPDQTLPQAPAELRPQWLAMKDTHEFFPLLQRMNVTRLTALQGVGVDLAQIVPNDTVEQMLQAVVDRDIAMMCFVGNRSLIQIHSGPIKKLLRTGQWFNILEPHFNLHLDTSAIDVTWIVNKPTKDGWLTSLECFDKNGDMIAQFYGARKPGIPELAEWRKLLVGYCPEPLAA